LPFHFDNVRVAVIGSGLGGLLSGICLQKKGFDVTVFESLRYPGGRFTNRNYKGYQISTGALHMIPHGSRGPFGQMLTSLDLNFNIIDSVPNGEFRINNRNYLFDEIPDVFSFVDRIKLTIVFSKLLTFGDAGDESLHDWLKKQIKNPIALQLTDSFCGWALSINSTQISAKEFIAITKNIKRFKGPGIPIGGCKGITDAIIDGFENENGHLKLGCKVGKIGIEKDNIKHIEVNNEKKYFDIIVSDIGPKGTNILINNKFSGDYLNKINKVEEASGIKISVACDKPMLGHTGVLFTPESRRIDGVNEVTNADSKLAPDGKHLLMAHQAFTPGSDVRKEIQLGIVDLHNIFPNFKKNCRVISAQCYRGNWPVNRAVSGLQIDHKTPINGLFLVGDSVKPSGYMETEGVAAGVELAIKSIENL
jgi:phytoene dehydrogenase-like protein|tara:strand:+ start:2802 stop:4064 length:1263 start_codon:yes stop_codon:yes gene_type:complete